MGKGCPNIYTKNGGVHLKGVFTPPHPRRTRVKTSVRKMVSRAKFAEQIFTPPAEQNFQMRAQIILVLRVEEQCL